MNEQIQKGRSAYQQMESACDQLVKSGNWQRVGASDIKLFLDMYTQSLLLRMAQANGAVSAFLGIIQNCLGGLLGIPGTGGKARMNVQIVIYQIFHRFFSHEIEDKPSFLLFPL